jgi:uncharacterized membrane protein YhfC
MNNVVNKRLAGLYEAFAQQHMNLRGGYRGNMKDVAIYIPSVKLNPRDRQVLLSNGVQRTVPYWILNQSKQSSDDWIAHNFGAENLSSVQEQLV